LRACWFAAFQFVAELHDTSVPIIEEHYRRFVAKHGDDLVRATLLETARPAANNVVAMRRK